MILDRVGLTYIIGEKTTNERKVMLPLRRVRLNIDETSEEKSTGGKNFARSLVKKKSSVSSSSSSFLPFFLSLTNIDARLLVTTSLVFNSSREKETRRYRISRF